MLLSYKCKGPYSCSRSDSKEIVLDYMKMFCFIKDLRMHLFLYYYLNVCECSVVLLCHSKAVVWWAILKGTGMHVQSGLHRARYGKNLLFNGNKHFANKAFQSCKYQTS